MPPSRRYVTIAAYVYYPDGAVSRHSRFSIPNSSSQLSHSNSMALKQQIQQDMIAAMKAKEEIKVSALRMLKAAILKFETAGDRKEAGDEDVLTIIGKEVKQRKDAAEEFKKGGRPEMAAREEQEMALLQAYLPAQMSEGELRTVIQDVIKQIGATSKADMGKVMGALMPKVRGRADGGFVNKLVGEMLA